MSRNGLILSAVLLIVLAGGAYWIFSGDSEPQGMSPDEQAAMVKHGKQLATIADCTGCHTPKGGQPYAGGLPMKSPFGTFYASNITQDNDTGIGTWTYEDFKRALHEGIRKGGDYIYPAMPFVSYTQIKDDDVKALWEYFKTVDPVTNKVPDPKLIVVDSAASGLARYGLLPWRTAYFEPGRFKPDPNRSDEYNRGAYYVHALGHCSSCHTPRNVAYAQKKDEFLNGFTLNGWYAPRISAGPYASIRQWNVDQLTDFLKNGELGKQNIAVGPMHEVWKDSLQHVPREDLKAMAVYLKEMPVDDTPGPKRIAIEPEQQKAGQIVYKENCKTCHGDNGEGTYGVAPALAGNNLVFAHESNSIVMSLLEGFDPKNVWGAMPSFAKDLSDDELVAVTNYVRTAWGNDASADATLDMVKASREVAKVPPGGQRRAVICPSLQADIIRPALQWDDKTTLAAFSDDATLSKLIKGYQKARSNASSDETVNALTAAYCRVMVQQDGLSEEQRKERVGQFAGKVAEVRASIQ